MLSIHHQTIYIEELCKILRLNNLLRDNLIASEAINTVDEIATKKMRSVKDRDSV